MHRFLIPLLALALSSLGCSSAVAGPTDAGGTGTSESLSSGLLAQSWDRLRNDPARFEGRVELPATEDGSGALAGAVIVTGSYDPARSALSIEADLGEILSAIAEGDPLGAGMFAAVASDPIRIVMLEDTAWMRWTPLMFLGVAGEWLETTSDSAGDLVGGLGLAQADGELASPVAMLIALAEYPVRTEVVGTETIRGFETTRHRVEFIDPATGTGGPGDLDLWLDDTGLVHRFSLDTLPVAASFGTDSAISQTWELSDHGVDVAIGRPTGRIEVVDDIEKVVGDVLGRIG